MTVYADGMKLAEQTLQNKNDWQDVVLNVASLAGKDTILNFSFRYPELKKSFPGNIQNTLHIGGIFFE